MANYYTDPAAAGAADGTSWTDAWTTLQSALDTATAGDVVYCRGTQTLAARLDVDAQTGTNVAPIKFIGTNAAGVVDGTRFVLDADGGTFPILDIYIGRHYYYFENFEFKDCGSITVGTLYIRENCDYWMLVNCWINTSAKDGVNNGLRARNWYTMQLKVTGCAGIGLSGINSWRCQHIRIDNCATGISTTNAWWGTDLVITNCSTTGLYTSIPTFFKDSIIHGCGVGVSVDGLDQINLEGLRITGNTTGLAIGNGKKALLAGCYFGGNTTDIALTGTGTYDIIPISTSEAHVTLAGTDPDNGYVNSAGGNYSIAPTATGKSIAVFLD